jgi:hypothetical protein
VVTRLSLFTWQTTAEQGQSQPGPDPGRLKCPGKGSGIEGKRGARCRCAGRQIPKGRALPLRWASVGKEPVYLSFRKAERLVKAGAPDAGGVVASVVAAAAAALAAVFVAESTRTVLPDVLTGS